MLKDEAGLCTKKEYLRVARRIARVLTPEQTPEEIEESIQVLLPQPSVAVASLISTTRLQSDWVEDAGSPSAKTIAYDSFCDAMFEVAGT